ncbi:MAG: discoidin domain-containing protein, partial [Victivallales bacterium]|nr:discoidin domain-containing protein [Victivallales bacterium]
YGYLDKAEYLPVALKAYNALTTVCQLSPGRIGYMQVGSDSPDNYRNEAFTKMRSNRFGNGLFLLAASALMRMCDDYQPPLLTVPLDFQSQVPSFMRPESGFYKKKITVTSPSPFQSGNSPDKLCDGKWSEAHGERWSTDTWPAVVDFDFGTKLTFRKIAVIPMQKRNYAFTMEFSDDGVAWRKVIDHTKPHRNEIIFNFDLPPQTARFARLTVRKAPGCFNGPWISLKEICFYEKK